MLYGKNLKLNITEGPSKMDLITALAYAFDKRNPFYVEFETRLVDTEDDEQQQLARYLYDRKYGHLVVRIQSLEHEDSSGMSFNFKGFVMSRRPHSKDFITTHSVDGWYSVSALRKGYLNVKMTLADGKNPCKLLCSRVKSGALFCSLGYVIIYFI